VRDVFRTGTGIEQGGWKGVLLYERDGALLGPEDGMARIIAPGDKGGARNVTRVARIRVLDPPW
jgi:hypothetical protein